MIIGNNTNNFGGNQFSSSQRSNEFTSENNNFQNKWNTIQENGQNRYGNGFVKDIKDQKYADTLNSDAMSDRTLAMLHERLQNNTISLEEFNRKCMQLGQARQDMAKRNKMF